MSIEETCDAVPERVYTHHEQHGALHRSLLQSIGGNHLLQRERSVNADRHCPESLGTSRSWSQSARTCTAGTRH